MTDFSQKYSSVFYSHFIQISLLSYEYDMIVASFIF